MRRIAWVAVVSLVAWGCGGAPSSPPHESLIGNWLSIESTGFGVAMEDFNADGTYSRSLATSASSLEAEIEDGTYSATDTSITWTPTRWSCPGRDPASTATYSFSGAKLVVRTPIVTTTFAPNNAPSSGQMVGVQSGCFAGNGDFTPMPVAPATN